MQFTVFPVTRLLAPKSRVYGAERIPECGPGVLAPTHFAAIDGFVIGSFSTRTIWFMVKAEVANLPIIGEALGWTGGFSARRGTCSHHTLRNARELVKSGHLVGIFPEGTRQRLPRVAENLEKGAAYVSLREGVPIIPCAIDSVGWSSRRNRRSCCVVFGEPMTFSDLNCSPDGYREATNRLRAELVRLFALALEATESGFPPQLSDGTTANKPRRIKAIRRVPNARRVSGHPRSAPERGEAAEVLSLVFDQEPNRAVTAGTMASGYGGRTG